MGILWRSLRVPASELLLDRTLPTGQSFRWRRCISNFDQAEWLSVLAGRVYILRQLENDVEYHCLNSKDDDCVIDDERVLRDYFQLDRVCTVDLYTSLIKRDAQFKKFTAEASSLGGYRILRQDPVETLFSFICSSNNNIMRITSLVEKLCVHYGDKVTTYDGVAYHSFPRIASLATRSVEAELRSLGFGYRAKYIQKTAAALIQLASVEKDMPCELITTSCIPTNIEEPAARYLYSLRTVPYLSAKKELLQLCGVGPKVADCVLLMSMDQNGAVPIDTHIWKIYTTHYRMAWRNKALTSKMYDEIGNHLRDLWGDYAGWAQGVMFSADLQKKNNNDNKTTNKKRDLVQESEHEIEAKRPCK